MAIAFLSVCASSRAQQTGLLHFDNSTWDFGKIDEQDGPVSHKFVFKNLSDTPVIVEKVATSCGCTSTDYTRQPIAAGSTGEITVVFNPRGFEGEFEKSVFVTAITKGDRVRSTLKIIGNVAARPKSVEDLYPFYMASGIRFDNATLAFNYIGQGNVKSMVVKYINTSDKDVKIEFEPAEQSGMMTIFAPETICPGCSGQITLTYDLERQTSAYGIIHDTNFLIANGTKSGTPLYTAMIGTDDFSETSLELAPKAVFSSQFHDFGMISRRAKAYTFTLRLTNDGYLPLVIRAVENKKTFRTELEAGTVIAPSSSIEVKMHLDSSQYLPQEIFESIVIILNDPLRPMREIKCAARIAE